MVEKGSFTLQKKDYSQILNIIGHMLEDSNVLVYMEAIKSVEYLATIMNKQIKAKKVKHFVQLLVDKYKETKTAVISSINKALVHLADKGCISYLSLLEMMIA